MQLDIAYNELSVLRELVKKRMVELPRADEPFEGPCCSEPQILARLQRKFEDGENEIRMALGLEPFPTSMDKRVTRAVLARLKK
jgi:hypothetical protein